MPKMGEGPGWIIPLADNGARSQHSWVSVLIATVDSSQAKKLSLRQDRFADGSERSLVVQNDGCVPALDPELLPELIEIHWMRRVAHLRIKLLQNRNANRFITNPQRPQQIPIGGNVAARLQDSAERILQPLFVGGALMYFHIGQQAKERAAPIRPAPGRCEIQSAIARCGQTLRKIAHYVRPNLPRGEIANLDARDRFDVGRQSFLDPMVFFGDARKAEMHHLVRHHPVGVKARGSRGTPNRDGDLAAVGRAEGLPGADPVTCHVIDAHDQMIDWKSSEIFRHRAGGAGNPF